MSKILLIAARTNAKLHDIAINQQAMTNSLIPEVIQPNEVKVMNSDGLFYLIFNPVNTIEIIDQSVSVGKIISKSKDWGIPKMQKPDGTFALFRANTEYVEVVSDILASRTIFFYHNEDYFIASTSQRAIIQCLKSYVFNDHVIPWILFTGYIGPENSWDRRIKIVPGNSLLRLNRKTWKLELISAPVKFIANRQTDLSNYESFKSIMTDFFNNLDIDLDKWILPLSGGYDSRGLLLFLKNRPGLKTITWGIKESIHQDYNDAQIANQLAQHFNIENEYLTIDFQSEQIDTLINRYLLAGEGRIDHIGGYLDGLKLWGRLFNLGYTGLIRGDHSFGRKSVYSEEDVYNSLNINNKESYHNLRNYNLGALPEQIFPDFFQRDVDESFSTWRDRLHGQYRVPCMLAALNEIKSPFVEIFSPYLTSEVVNFIRTLPDNVRTNKYLIKELISDLSPDIPIARENAIVDHHHIVQDVSFAKYVKNELNNSDNSLFPRNTINTIVNNIVIESEALNGNIQRIHTYQKVKSFLPSWTKSLIRKAGYKKNLSPNLLAFRFLILIKMKSMLEKDACLLNK